MAKNVDPDTLNQGVEVVINTTAKTIQLLIAGNLNDAAPGRSSGVTLQAVYSFLKEEWRTDAALNKFKFPLKAITEAKMDLVNGWSWADAQTRDLIRDGGWQETNGDRYMSVITLGSMVAEGSDLAYYQQTAGFAATTVAMDKTGPVNEPVMIYNGTGPVDLTTYFKILLREQGKTYSQSNLLVDQDLSALTYTVYKIPLSNATDIKVSTADATIDISAPYTGMSVDYLKGARFSTFANATVYAIGDVVRDTATGRWFKCTVAGTSNNTAVATDTGCTWVSFAGERQIGANWYAFNRIVVGNNATAEQIYEWAQRQLRKTTDINANTNLDGFGTVNGNVAIPLLGFVGDTLITNPGVYVSGFNVNDQNRITFKDITVDGGGLDAESVPATTSERTFPFVAAGTMSFSANLVADTSAQYRMYFATDDAGDNTGRDFDTATAIVVNNNAGSPIEGVITTGDVTFDFDYDGNIQRGAASAGLDAPVVIVAQGLDGAEWVSAAFTITRATGLSFPVNAADERNYLNPA